MSVVVHTFNLNTQKADTVTFEFKVSLVYILSLRTGQPRLQREILSKQRKQANKQKQ